MNDTNKNEVVHAIEKLSGKFDVMHGQISDIQKEVSKIPEMQKKISRIEKEVAKIPEMQKEVAKIPEMQKEVAKIPEMQKEIAKISEIQKEIAEIKKETRNISKSVAVIEHEHGDKLKALFDAFMINNEKIYSQQERISFCEKKLENHDTEIYYLKTKVQGL